MGLKGAPSIMDIRTAVSTFNFGGNDMEVRRNLSTFMCHSEDTQDRFCALHKNLKRAKSIRELFVCLAVKEPEQAAAAAAGAAAAATTQPREERKGTPSKRVAAINKMAKRVKRKVGLSPNGRKRRPVVVLNKLRGLRGSGPAQSATWPWLHWKGCGPATRSHQWLAADPGEGSSRSQPQECRSCRDLGKKAGGPGRSPGGSGPPLQEKAKGFAPATPIFLLLLLGGGAQTSPAGAAPAPAAAAGSWLRLLGAAAANFLLLRLLFLGGGAHTPPAAAATAQPQPTSSSSSVEEPTRPQQPQQRQRKSAKRRLTFAEETHSAEAPPKKKAKTKHISSPEEDLLKKL
ncbi:hypothetical protein D5F01_LYC23774 [Larimichthys crocea]|uniref:Uncharacterized protein n=1 Tax=Larimichthys crocea TaxID=215358 RepID=A0A6G0HG04_LARCR|nr:hypothetical protein D5F01_LYC23774 [Larimichthys crocea]